LKSPIQIPEAGAQIPASIAPNHTSKAQDHQHAGAIGHRQFESQEVRQLMCRCRGGSLSACGQWIAPRLPRHRADTARRLQGAECLRLSLVRAAIDKSRFAASIRRERKVGL
jgi:hypothetical protein